MRVAINGFGRIGRNVLRAWIEARFTTAPYPFDLVAVNDIGSAEALVHLLRYDTTHGRFGHPVVWEEGVLSVGTARLALTHHADPGLCPWDELGVDVVLECTGLFRARAQAACHIEAGASRVIIAAVGFDVPDRTLVYGVNHTQLQATDRVISGASCTTHCIAPLLQLLDRHWSIRNAMMTEIHAYTSDQHLLDKVHRDLRRARAGAANLIPTTSSSIGALQQVLPGLRGRIGGYSMRVPTLNVAVVDLTLTLVKMPDPNSVHAVMSEAAATGLSGILGYCEEPLVSSDFNHRTESAIFDATQTQVVGDLLRISAWYDNEWGYTHRLLDLLAYMQTYPNEAR
jgi:glyceraldehyde 3-phosphate dehydrogenase